MIYGQFCSIFWGPHAEFGQPLKLTEAEYKFWTNFKLRMSKIVRTDSDNFGYFVLHPCPLCMIQVWKPETLNFLYLETKSDSLKCKKVNYVSEFSRCKKLRTKTDFDLVIGVKTGNEI